MMHTSAGWAAGVAAADVVFAVVVAGALTGFPMPEAEGGVLDVAAAVDCASSSRYRSLEGSVD